MDIFNLTAYAQAAGAAAKPTMLETMMPFVFLIGVFYFLFIRPQAKKAREHDQLLGGLKTGDEIVTSGGIIGRIRTVNDIFVSVEIANDTVIKVIKANVSGLTKGKQEVVKTNKNPKKAKVTG